MWSAVALAGVWLAVAATIVAAYQSRTTPEDVAAFAERQDFAALSAEQRRDAVDALASRVNRLSFEQRRDPAMQRAIRELFEQMNEPERLRYVDRALPKGLEQLFESINAMEPAERRALVDETLSDMRRDLDRASRAEIEARVEDPAFQRVIDRGMEAYLSEASAEAKLDLEPLIHAMQSELRELR